MTRDSFINGTIQKKCYQLCIKASSYVSWLFYQGITQFISGNTSFLPKIFNYIDFYLVVFIWGL